ncbi:MAG: hypothetical protein ACRECO_03240, partial [Xanthobacteraceae bacterium]
MTCTVPRFAIMPAIGAAMLLATSAASAQGPFAFLDRLFGDSERVSPGAPPQQGNAPHQQGNPQAAPQQPATMQDGRVAQAPPHELIARINRLEAQIRQMTGVIEQLQHRNRQLENQVKGGAAGTPGAAAPPQSPPHAAASPMPAPQASASPPQVAAPAPRGDVFDPTQHPGAPGAPHALGSIHSGSSGGPATMPHDPNDPVGAPGGRDAGAPLDLSTLAAGIATSPPPPQTGGG